MAGSLAWSLFGLFGHRPVAWQDSCEARWQPPGRTRGALPVRLQEPCNLRIWGFLPSRDGAVLPTVDAMEIWVLGTLEVSHDGRAVDVRGPMPRRLLALLALTPGREMSTDRLVDGLWGEEPPAAAAATLQSHVARLRRDLSVPDVVRRGRHGYVLDLDPAAVDAHALEGRVTRGQHGPGRGASRRGQQRADRSAEPVARDAVRRVRRLRAARGRGRATGGRAARRPRAPDLRRPRPARLHATAGRARGAGALAPDARVVLGPAHGSAVPGGASGRCARVVPACAHARSPTSSGSTPARSCKSSSG